MKNKIKKKTSNLEHKIFELSDTCYKIITKYPSIEKHAFEFLNFRNAHPVPYTHLTLPTTPYV